MNGERKDSSPRTKPVYCTVLHLNSWVHLHVGYVIQTEIWVLIYPNLPEVDAITKAAYVRTNPTEKCVSPTRRACTIESATGLSFHFTKFASGVRSCAHTSVSISSCQYPRHEIRNMNPVA